MTPAPKAVLVQVARLSCPEAESLTQEVLGTPKLLIAVHYAR